MVEIFPAKNLPVNVRRARYHVGLFTKYQLLDICQIQLEIEKLNIHISTSTNLQLLHQYYYSGRHLVQQQHIVRYLALGSDQGKLNISTKK